MKKLTKKRILLLCVLVLLIALAVWTIWGNTALEMNMYTVSCDNLPAAFEGYRIVHISDLHNTEIGEDNEKLLKMISDLHPDLIAITGDMVDSRRTDMDTALSFAEKAAEIAPCFYVPGNHEARISEYDALRLGLSECGVTVLENERIDLECSGESIALLGISDPSFAADRLDSTADAYVKKCLTQLASENDICTILLSHRPELFDTYCECEIDLVLSGHAHGGQIRLPVLGGVIAPNQGLFPKYDAGLFTRGSTNMIVSRGIGNSLFPLRFNNRPEVILIELESLQ